MPRHNITDQNETEKKIDQEKIIFERLVALGDYSNVRIGGTFNTNPNLTDEENWLLVMDKINNQIETFSKTRAGKRDESTLQNALEEINEFTNALKEKIKSENLDAAFEYQKTKNQIQSIDDTLNNLMYNLYDLNYKLNGAFIERQKLWETLVEPDKKRLERKPYMYRLSESGEVLRENTILSTEPIEEDLVEEED